MPENKRLMINYKVVKLHISGVVGLLIIKLRKVYCGTQCVSGFYKSINRFCSIRDKNAGVAHFRGKFRAEWINRRQPRLVLWVGEGLGSQKEETRR